MFLTRLEMLVGFLLAVGAGWVVWRLWLRYRLQRLSNQEVPEELAELVPSGQPVVLYFTSEGCVQCRLQQSPILEQFSTRADVPVLKLDAVSQAELADFYGVMTVPTTVVLGRQRQPVAVNYGLASLQQLQQQVAAA